MDKLIVEGIPALNGVYEFDITELLALGAPGALTNREGHRIKMMSGVRVGELMDALEAGDNDVVIALAAIVMTRKGKRVDEELLWDAPIGGGVTLDIATRVEEGDAEDPPAEAATAPQTNGGESGKEPLESQVNGRSRIGLPNLETPTAAPDSDRATSAI